MVAVLAVLCTLVGLGVGSFLNVVIWRVPRKESVVRPPSHCPSCGQRVAERDNVPVLSWLLLRGRCRGCRSPIGVRYPLVELACAGLFAATAVRFGADWALPAYLVLAAGLLALSVIDLDHKLLPNRVVYPTGCALAALLIVASLARRQPERLLSAAIGAVAAFGLFFLLHFISPRGMAFGDVRLSFVLGLGVGWLDLWSVPVFLFLAFLSSAIIGLAYAVISGKGLKAAIPFGPFLALGAEVAVFVGPRLASGWSGR